MGVLNGMSPDKKGVALPKSEFATRPPASSLDRSAGDEELTNLNWLQKNLLQDFTLDLTEAPPTPGPLVHSGATPHRGPAQKAKPPLSFSLLIYMAIDQSPGKSLAVKDIYNWILQHFPYFSSAPTGWKNSVRHNLSLNKCFRKVEKSLGKVSGKGSLWCVDPEHRPNLVQALKKQHFPTGSLPPPACPPRVFSGQIFLQRCALRESDIDAASAMMLLNSGSGHHNDFCDPDSPSHPPDSVLVSSDPKQDHTYSSSSSGRAGSEGFLSDEDEGSEEEQRSGTMELDEELKEAAGSLLHLAGVQPGLDLCRRTLRNSTKISFLRD